MSNTANTKLSINDLNAVLGRELVPGRLGNAFLRAANLLSGLCTDKVKFHRIRFNNAQRMTSIKLDEGCRPTHQDATCYYMVDHTHCHKGVTGGKMHFTPWLGISIGMANGGDIWGSESMVHIMLDTRKPDDVEIEYVATANLGMAYPQQHDQKLAIMRIARGWMDRIDKGETLDPVECRQQIKTATGLADWGKAVCPQTGLDRMLARLSAPYTKKIVEERSLKASARLKQIYSMGRDRKKLAP